jgi:hypothetical protein
VVDELLAVKLQRVGVLGRLQADFAAAAVDTAFHQ